MSPDDASPYDRGAEQPDPASLARDWITIWQSEAAGLAADRELQEAAQRMADLWARTAQAAANAWIAPGDGPAGRPGPAAPAGAAAAADAPGPGKRDSGELARLRERVAELESRLAALERGR